MAKSLLSVRTKKKPKVTRSEAYLVNVKYLGEEPDVNKFKTKADYIRALSWYGSMCDTKDAREYLKDYLTHNKEFEKAKRVDKIPDNWVPLTAAWQVRILMNQKAKFDLEPYVKFMATLDEAFTHIKEEKSEEKKSDKPSIQDRIKDRLSDIIGDIEEMIDSGVPFSLYDWLKKNEIPVMYATKIGDYYGPIWNEMVQAHAGKLDGYEKWTKAQLKARVEFYNSLVTDAERYGSVAKKTRAVRKPRPVSVEKQLKGLKYQKESAEYKLASIDPQKIIGAQELWTFNTKYGNITIFRALDRGGLKVKGTSITGFDEKQSFSYKTGRKTGDVVDRFSKATKAGVKKAVEILKPHAFNARINENTILIKVLP
jgi:hypothetical protein